MKKVSMIVSLLFLLLLTISIAQAQEALTQTFTSTANENIVSARIPENWSAHSYPSDNHAEIALLEEAPNHLTGEIDFPATSRGGNSPHEIATFPTSYVKGTVTDIEINGRPAARLDGTSNDSTVLYIVVTTSMGDFVQVSFGGPADAMAEEEATLLAIATSITTGDPNAVDTAAAPSATTATAEAAISVPVVNGTSEIAFPGLDVAHSNIFLTDLAGQNVMQLTHAQLETLLPSWSPDGTMIAYTSDTSTTGTYAYDLFIVPSSGGEPRKISSVPSLDRIPTAWSPDSKQLIFVSRHDSTAAGSQIYRVNADGSDEQMLTIDAQAINGFTLDWSPDGKHIAFIAFPNAGPDYRLLVADPDGSNMMAIPNIHIMQVGEFFKWSPDGQHAVLTDQTSLTVMNADGSAPHILIDASANLNIGGVSWSPDGTQIAFTVYSNADANFILYLYTINADGSNQQQVDLGGQEVMFGGVSWGILPSTASTSAPAAAPTAASNTTAASTSACSITAVKGANLRTGPGTTFDRAGALAAGASQSVVGQANGSDGFVWWKLDSGSWVRSDLVQTGGDCTAVPTVAA